MLKVEGGSSQIHNGHRVHFTMRQFIHVYEGMLGKTDAKGTPGEFLTFYENWKKSDVYEIECGYLRFEPYPTYGAATVHGLFTKNPFRSCENIKSMLDWYLGEHPEFNRLECHVNNRFRGVRKLVASLAHSSVQCDSKTIFYRGREE